MTYSRAQPSSKPPHLHGVKKRHWGDSQSRETGDNDGFCRRGKIRGNVRKDRRKEADWKEADWKEMARTMANDKIAAEKINKMAGDDAERSNEVKERGRLQHSQTAQSSHMLKLL